MGGHDYEGAASVAHERARDAAVEQPAERAPGVAAHHQQIGPRGELRELLRGLTGSDLDARRHREVRDRVLQPPLGQLALLAVAAARVDRALATAWPGRLDDVDDAQTGTQR